MLARTSIEIPKYQRTNPFIWPLAVTDPSPRAAAGLSCRRGVVMKPRIAVRHRSNATSACAPVNAGSGTPPSRRAGWAATKSRGRLRAPHGARRSRPSRRRKHRNRGSSKSARWVCRTTGTAARFDTGMRPPMPSCQRTCRWPKLGSVTMALLDNAQHLVDQCFSVARCLQRLRRDHDVGCGVAEQIQTTPRYRPARC